MAKSFDKDFDKLIGKSMLNSMRPAEEVQAKLDKVSARSQGYADYMTSRQSHWADEAAAHAAKQSQLIAAIKKAQPTLDATAIANDPQVKAIQAQIDICNQAVKDGQERSKRLGSRR